jgi:hypothetical protein
MCPAYRPAVTSSHGIGVPIAGRRRARVEDRPEVAVKATALVPHTKGSPHTTLVVESIQFVRRTL